MFVAFNVLDEQSVAPLEDEKEDQDQEEEALASRTSVPERPVKPSITARANGNHERRGTAGGLEEKILDDRLAAIP